MAFTLEADRPLDVAVRKVVRKQWKRVGAGLAGGESVHETRKALKRLRSLGALLAPVTGTRATQRLDRDLRDLSRSLSGRRDQEVLGSAWRAFGADADLSADVIESGQIALSTWAARQRVERDIDVGRTSRRVGRTLDALPLDGVAFDDLIPGARATYRDAQRAFAEARALETSEAYHDWRKVVQRHFRHMTLLTALWPETMGARAALARDLSHTIGDEHDLTLLAQWLRSTDLPGAIAAVAPRLRRQLDKRCATLRRQARREGRRLFADRPKAFARRLCVYAATMAPPPVTKPSAKPVRPSATPVVVRLVA